MESSVIINNAVAQHFVLDINDKRKYSKQDIIDTINYLIQHDMDKLLFILYRVDVAEEKIRSALSNSMNEDAAVIIYQHIYERELEKAVSREKFSTGKGWLEE